MLNILGFEITPKIDAGHIAIVMGVISTWLVTIRQARINSLSTPYRLTALEAQNEALRAQNEIMMTDLRHIKNKQSCIEKKVTKAVHDGSNTRMVTGRIYDEVHKTGEH